MKINTIYDVQPDKIKEVLSESMTYGDFFNKLGLKNDTAQRFGLRQMVRIFSIDLTEFKKNVKTHLSSIKSEKGSNGQITEQYNNDEIFTIESKHPRETLRRRIIKYGLLECRCESCGVGTEYNGEPLTLHLDHKNGVNNDNRLVNLRFLCPNCHSQTSTYARAKRTNNWSPICKCGVKKGRGHHTCRECADINNGIKNRIFNPSPDEFKLKLQELNWNNIKIGEFYGVSDKAISKRCKKLCLTRPAELDKFHPYGTENRK